MAIKERLLYIDRLKGIAILLVVCGHFIQFNMVGYPNNKLFNLIYSFHMPLFMFISGYVAYKTNSVKIFENYGLFLRKKSISLLVPFFSWPLIVNKFFFTKNNDLDFYQTFLQLIKNPGIGLWFLWYLYFLVLIYSFFLFLSQKFNSNKNIWIDIIIYSINFGLLVLISRLHIIDNSFILYYIFFFVGIFLSKYEFIKNFLLRNYVFSASLVAFIILDGRYDFLNGSTINLILKLLISLSAIASLYFIVINLKFNNIIDKYIINCGQNSLIIYTTHIAMLHLFSVSNPLPYDINTYLLMVMALFASVIVIFICMSIFKIVQQSKFVNFLLYGIR